MAISDKQLQANRQNTLKSTGPRTELGKSFSSKNATTHGLCAQQIVIEGETQEEYNDFRNILIASLAPVGPVETLLVDIIVAGFWRHRRTGQIEAQVLDNLREDLSAERLANSPDPMLITLPGPATTQIRIGLAIKRLLERYLESESNPQVVSTLSQVEDTIEYFKTHPDTVYIPDLMRFMQYLREISVDSDFFSDQDTRDLDKAIEDLSRIKAAILEDARPNLGHAISADFSSNNIVSKLTRYATQIQGSLFKAMHELQRLQATRQGQQVPPPAVLDVNITNPE